MLQKNPPLCPYQIKIKSHAWMTGSRCSEQCSETPIFSKCFENIIRDYICSLLPASMDTLQFAYCINRSTDDAFAFTQHTALSHLKNKNTYVRMLFVDYSSEFKTIVPATMVAKLQTLGLNRSLYSWILDFLTGRSQVVTEWATIAHLPWCSTLVLLRAVSSAHSCTPCTTWLSSHTQFQRQLVSFFLRLSG